MTQSGRRRSKKKKMKHTNWKDIAELIGVSAIVASLIFVGLQMKQSQEIAIAAQYHDRAALAIENFGNLMSSELNTTTGIENRLIEVMPDASPEIRAFAYLSSYSFHTLGDNHLFQYQSGFMQEEAWEPRRAQIASVLMKSEISRDVCLRLEFRLSYQQLCEELINEKAERHSDQ